MYERVQDMSGKRSAVERSSPAGAGRTGCFAKRYVLVGPSTSGEQVKYLGALFNQIWKIYRGSMAKAYQPRYYGTVEASTVGSDRFPSVGVTELLWSTSPLIAIALNVSRYSCMLFR
jgi:hypothetical protein